MKYGKLFYQAQYGAYVGKIIITALRGINEFTFPSVFR